MHAILTIQPKKKNVPSPVINFVSCCLWILSLVIVSILSPFSKTFIFNDEGLSTVATVAHIHVSIACTVCPAHVYELCFSLLNIHGCGRPYFRRMLSHPCHLLSITSGRSHRYHNQHSSQKRTCSHLHAHPIYRHAVADTATSRVLIRSRKAVIR